MKLLEVTPLQFEDQALYLVEGTLSELQIARTTVNLLEQIDRNIKANSAVTSSSRSSALECHLGRP